MRSGVGGYEHTAAERPPVGNRNGGYRHDLVERIVDDEAHGAAAISEQAERAVEREGEWAAEQFCDTRAVDGVDDGARQAEGTDIGEVARTRLAIARQES